MSRERTRLADVLMLPYWPIWLIGWLFALVLLLRRNQRAQTKELERIGAELAETVVTRWATTDKHSDTMLSLNCQMVRLTWAVVVLTVVVLGATLLIAYG